MKENNPISARTIADYQGRAEAFWTGTRGHDVTQNYAALLDAMDGAPPFSILDLGCGPGRDLQYFKSLGHEAVGLDATPAFVSMARDHSGCEVWDQDFLSMNLPAERFHGVFANATLFHVPTAELPRVLGELRAALKTRGVLFASNPHGNNDEGMQGGRYCSFWDWPTWRGFLTGAGFDELDHYYRPAGKPRAEQPWLASVWRKTS